MGLILQKIFAAHRFFLPGIKHHGEMRGLSFLNHIQQGIGKSEYSGGVHPCRVYAGIIDEGKIGSVHQGKAIQKEDRFFGFHICKVNKIPPAYSVERMIFPSNSEISRLFFSVAFDASPGSPFFLNFLAKGSSVNNRVNRLTSP